MPEDEPTHAFGPEVQLTGVERERERCLVLADRVAAFEAAAAGERPDSILPASGVLAAEQRLIDMRSSWTWRVGRLATAPARVARRALNAFLT